jgi:hypothetical protein
MFEQESDNAERATLDRGDERSLAPHLLIGVGSSVEKQANSGFVPVATGPGQRGIALPMVLTLVGIGTVGQQRGDDPAVAPGGCCTERSPLTLTSALDVRIGSRGEERFRYFWALSKRCGVQGCRAAAVNGIRRRALCR